jgi:hypothetical protein
MTMSISAGAKRHMSDHMSSHSYQDATFEVWPNQQTWLWFVVSRFGGGTIGAAATEAQAIADACSSIEEAQTSSALRTEHCSAAALGAIRWNESLASLDCYLARVGCENA